MAQQELRTPYALRDKGISADNALQQKVSFTVEETLVSVHRILKNFCLAARLECATPVAPLKILPNKKHLKQRFFQKQKQAFALQTLREAEMFISFKSQAKRLLCHLGDQTTCVQ
jgi:hypothetical protein